MVRLEMAVGVRILFCYSILPVDEMSRSTETVVDAVIGCTFVVRRRGGGSATIVGCVRYVGFGVGSISSNTWGRVTAW